MVRKKKIKLIKKREISPEKRTERQFFWLVGIICLIILSVIFLPKIYNQLFNKFEYGGVQFEKIKQGQLIFYHGAFPIIYNGNFSAIYNVYFRTDPRENNIPINTNLSLSKKVSISLGEDVHLCGDMILGQSELGKFIPAFPFVKNVTAGVYNASIAKEYNVSQITCKNASRDNTVIIIQLSDNASIDGDTTKNCFVLNIGQCQYLETVERYIMGIMSQINEKSI